MPPPCTLAANQHERSAIIALIKEEHPCLQTLKHLIDVIDTNNQEILGLYKDSKITHTEDWGALAWGPLPDWEQPPPAPLVPANDALPQPPNPPPANKE